jgi:general secretion pathway protein M
MNALRERWAALAARERLLLTLAAGVIGLALLWAVGIQPAWRTLRAAPAAQALLEAQWQLMQRQAVEARELRAAPPLALGLAAQALQGATQRLGAQAKLQLQGDRAVLTLNGVPGAAIAQWLAEARRGARARAVEARLHFDDAGYRGSIVVTLGGRT